MREAEVEVDGKRDDLIEKGLSEKEAQNRALWKNLVTHIDPS